MIDTRQTAAFATRPIPTGMAGLIARVVRLWSNRRLARTQLGRLDPHLLHDIGLSEDQARREAVKHFWIE
jgi:uncharacterized protein YjiS (DUF1127 family)